MQPYDLNPDTVLFLEEGTVLTARWLQVKSASEAEAARLAANPPPIQDVRVRFWPSKGSYTDLATGKTHSPEEEAAGCPRSQPRLR